MQEASDRGRRSAVEWTELIAAWEASGLDAYRFATIRKLPIQRLRWWKWHLRGRATRAAEVGLVRVEVAPDRERIRDDRVERPSSTPGAPPRWEVETRRGRLSVHVEIGGLELKVILAMLSAGDAKR